MTKRTPKSWVHYLSDEDGQYTLEEFTAGCLSRILGASIETAQAAGHTEGMIGSLDEFMSGTNPLYQRVAANRAKPGPMSAGVVPDALKGGRDGDL